MYTPISDNSSYLEESIEASGVKQDTNSNVSGSASTPLTNFKDLVKIEPSINTNIPAGINPNSKEYLNQTFTASGITDGKVKTDTNHNIRFPFGYDTTPTESLDNYFTTPVITDGNTPNMENQIFDSSIDKFVQKNNTADQSHTPETKSEARVYHKKVANLRDFNETLIPSVYPNLFDIKPCAIALIRINNNYKLLACRSSNEFELIKQLHGIMYSNTKHFNLEYAMIENVNLGYLTGELDNYGFLKYDDIQDDLTTTGENIKKLADARKALGCNVSVPKDNIIDVMPSFQTMMSYGNSTNEITGSNLFGNGKHFASEDYATVDPTFDTKRTMDIWYNHMFMSGLITEWEAMLKKSNISSKNVKQLGYFKEISIYKAVDVDGLIIQQLENLFNSELFNEKVQFQEKVNIILTRNNKTCPNLLQIRQYILDNYNLDSDVEHRIQFTTLLNEVSKGLNVSYEYGEMMKKSLPLVLVELNLNKKRYSGGFFWYGLVKKNSVSKNIKNYDKVNEFINLSEFKDKQAERLEKEYQSCLQNRGYSK